jgi:hypothetical protein
VRYEWGDLIRYRRWDVFETLAKERPSQQLCDTLHELRQGIKESADLKAIKKSLYLLKVAGFEPSVVDEVGAPVPKLPEIPGVGVMSDADGHGYRVLFAGIFKAGKVHSYLMVAAEKFRHVHLKCNVWDARIWPVMRKDLLEGMPATLVGEVQPAYVIFRQRRIWDGRMESRTHGKPDALLKQMFTRVPAQFPHPASGISPAKTRPEDRRLLLSDPICAQWRLFIRPDDPVWEEIHALRWDYELEAKQKSERVLTCLMRERARLCDDATVADFEDRFLDAALLLGSDPRAGRFVEAANDLRQRGYRSEVFEEILGHTASEIEVDIEADDIEQDLPRSRIMPG